MNYMTITHEDMLNGYGLREVLWVAGCEHHCPECHNPETWCKDAGSKFDAAAEKELLEHLDNDFIDGVTFSGGDPLAIYNVDDVTKLCKKIRKKFPHKSIWCYTGYSYEDVKDLEIMKYLDVLVDGEFIKARYSPNLMWKGSDNQRVINIKKTRASGEIVLEA